MLTGENRRQAYRCSVADELSNARLRTGLRNLKVSVRDTSRDGYTIAVTQAVADRIPDKPILLDFNGETALVEARGIYQDEPGVVRINFVRLADCTKYKVPSNWWSIFVPRTNLNGDPTLPVGLILAFLILSTCLPGTGDTLGTAPRVRWVLNNLWQIFDETIVRHLF